MITLELLQEFVNHVDGLNFYYCNDTIVTSYRVFFTLGGKYVIDILFGGGFEKTVNMDRYDYWYSNCISERRNSKLESIGI